MIQGRANELPDLQVFRTVLFYCLIIIILPVATFFVVKCIFFDAILGVDTTSSNVYSAVSAVIVLHVALGLYIYKAYTQVEQKPKPLKVD